MGRFEELRSQEAQTAQAELLRANRQDELLAELPPLPVVQALIERAGAGESGAIQAQDLPASAFWEAGTTGRVFSWRGARDRDREPRAGEGEEESSDWRVDSGAHSDWAERGDDDTDFWKTG